MVPAVLPVDLVVLDGLRGFLLHIPEREEVDESGDERDHGEHGRAEVIDAVAEFQPDAGAFVIADAGRGRDLGPGGTAGPGVGRRRIAGKLVAVGVSVVWGGLLRGLWCVLGGRLVLRLRLLLFLPAALGLVLILGVIVLTAPGLVLVLGMVRVRFAGNLGGVVGVAVVGVGRDAELA